MSTGESGEEWVTDLSGADGGAGRRKSTLGVQQIATYTRDPFRGNPAYVVTLDRPRPTTDLQRICAQLREAILAVLSEEGAAVHLRFVTPTGPHPGAGHATHAAAFVALRGRPGAALELRLADGARREVRMEGDLVSVDWSAMAFSEIDAVAAVAAAFGARPERTLEARFGLVAVYPDAGFVAELDPDFAAIARMAADTVILTAPSSADGFVVRVFAPRLDLPEDPVCGTAHRILTPYWAGRLGRRELLSRQLSPRGGELHCRVTGEVVTIAGAAAVFLDGRILAEA